MNNRFLVKQTITFARKSDCLFNSLMLFILKEKDVRRGQYEFFY